MHSTFYKTTALLSALTLSLSLILTGCSSSGESLPIPDINATHGMKDDSGATYGSGPNHTRPYPQSEEVNLNGVPGVTPKYEPLSRGGNKDYRVLGKDYEVWKNCSSYLEVGTASWYGPGFHGNKTSNGEVYNQKGYSAAHKNLPLPSYLKVTNLENGKAVVVRVNDRGPFHGSRIIDLSEGAARAIDMTAKGTAKVKLEYINVREGNVIANVAHPSLPGSGSANRDSIRELIENLKEGKKPSAATTVAAAVTVAKAVSAASDALEQADSSPQVSYVNSLEQNLLTTGSTADTTTMAAVNDVTGTVQIFTSGSSERAQDVRSTLQPSTAYPVEVIAEGNLYRVRVGPVPEGQLDSVLTQMRSLGYPDAFIRR